jgi:hypothetical protein
VVWHRRKDLELWLEILAQVHDRRNITTTVTVIGSRPYSDNVLVLEMVLVTFVHKLMRTRNEL